MLLLVNTPVSRVPIFFKFFPKLNPTSPYPHALQAFRPEELSDHAAGIGRIYNTPHVTVIVRVITPPCDRFLNDS